MPPDIALLGIGAYEPRWFMKPMHMNPAEAVAAHRDLGSRQSIGMHFGTFQLSSEGIDQPVADLKAALAEAAIPQSEFVTCWKARRASDLIPACQSRVGRLTPSTNR